MPARLDGPLLHQLKVCFDAGWTNPRVSRTFDVHATTVGKIRNNLLLFNGFYGPSGVHIGRPMALTAYDAELVLQYLDEMPTAYLDEVQQYLLDERGLDVSIWTVYRTIERAGWSRKAARKRAAERDTELRGFWRGNCLHWDPRRLVFVDESASNERTGWRKYGWSLKGVSCVDIMPAKRSERWSVLPAMTIDGYLPGFLVEQGSITGDVFVDWIEHSVLSQLMPESILIIDNASIHRSERLKEVVARAECFLEYLPPYSPNYNPIEESFSTLKAWIKRHYREAQDYENFGEFVRHAVEQVGGRSAVQQFRHAGYRELDTAT